MFIYLDHNATSLIDDDILELMTKAQKEYFANPSSTHALGRKAKANYLKAKDALAKFFSVSSSEVFFTSSATEAINWLLKHKTCRHIITSDLEHAAIYNTVCALKSDKTRVSFMHPGKQGFVDVELLKSHIADDTDLIILGAANSETGIIQDTTEISKLAKEKQIPLFIDAVGLFGKAEFKPDPNVTAYVISSPMIHGPKGIAALIHTDPKSLSTLYHGGYQESSKRAGTENLPAALGFAHAFEKLQSANFDHIKTLRDTFEAKLKERFDVTIIGENQPRVYNTSCVRFHGISGETLLQLLDQHGIYASHGSACSSGALEPSRVLINMDLGIKDTKETIRFSLSKYSTDKDIENTLSHLEILIQSLLALASI